VFEQGLEASICVQPQTGKILACNQAMHGTLGYEPNYLLGRSIRVLAPSPPFEVWNDLAKCFELRECDIEVLHQNGDQVLMSASVTAIWGAGGKILCGLVVLRKRVPVSPSWKTSLENQAQVNRLAYEISVAEARERERIARGLHDVVGQLHSLLKMKLDQLSETYSNVEAVEMMAEIQSLLSQATLATRKTTFDLSNPLVNLLGLKAAIESLSQTFGLPLRVEGVNETLPLPTPVLSVVFRVVRELLFNVRKHARAQHVLVLLNLRAGNLLIHIIDDGVGFDANALSGLLQGVGYGLVSTRMQILSLGGRMDVDSSPGAGTRISISVPLSAQHQ